mmetsp:Transcript_17575/g.51335  ORF Transcript_17575/g.51335 Transcript_17575/m.51335 type:complete len:224 (+) Transcript_17575:247-918(+)
MVSGVKASDAFHQRAVPVRNVQHTLELRPADEGRNEATTHKCVHADPTLKVAVLAPPKWEVAGTRFTVEADGAVAEVGPRPAAGPRGASGVACTPQGPNITAVVAAENHESVLPHAHLLHGPSDVCELIVKKVDHRKVDATVVLLDVREALLILGGSLQRIVGHFTVILKEEWFGLVVRPKNAEHPLPEGQLLVALADKVAGGPVRVPEVDDSWSGQSVAVVF